jgi:D-alanyl-D-alanine carboxypeptidase
MIQWRHHTHFRLYASIIAAILLAALGYGVYAYVSTARSLKETEEKLSSSLETVAALEKQNLELGGTLTLTQTEKEKINKDLEKQQEENEELEDEKEDLEEERDMLEKLAKTDKQLLAKYSKVYFLNENYSPIKLENIDPKYTLPVGKTLQFLEPAYPYLEELLEDANDAGIPLRVISAFRSFQTQAALKSGYQTYYGSGANTFSADQGYSEHQLGTTVDFTTPTIAAATGAFANTTAYKWLQANAHKYGFILSYPKSNSYYIYEPWHWRFVGEDLAQDLHKAGKNFYDMDQRDIDEYLIKLFD